MDDRSKVDEVLARYNVDAHVINVVRGASITRYELKIGDKSRAVDVKKYEVELQMALEVRSLRIQLPVEGKAVVGIEVPNKERKYFNVTSVGKVDKVSVPVGKSIDGEDILVSLDKLPHLLIAGTTGSGKSMCIDSMLYYLIKNYDPSDVRLMLIDPKIVEMCIYNNERHLLTPFIVTGKQIGRAHV